MRNRADAVNRLWLPSSSSPWVSSVLLAAFLLGIIILLGRAWLGSAENVVRAIRGAPAVAEQRVVDLGIVRVGTKATAMFTLRNLRLSDLRIAGANADCGCVAGPELPKVIDALGELTLPVTLHVQRLGASEVRVVWFLEDATESALPCAVRYCGIR